MADRQCGAPPAELSVQDLDAMAERMVPLADAVTWFVHGYQPDAVKGLLGDLTGIELRVLVVVLATLRRPRWTLPEDGIIDDIAVELAARGKPAALTKTERRLAAERIIAAGHGPVELAERLHLSGATANALYADLCATDPAHSPHCPDAGEPAEDTSHADQRSGRAA
ncbi:hypothetical protein ACIBHX_46570 [Nonomuraea sp. NPDC050536]|uniref:hypothetical protein n=1 Tax=Nonomuraea sp. NPDC050536 TaxID=3364366 RepID=UPI0037C96DB8